MTNSLAQIYMDHFTDSCLAEAEIMAERVVFMRTVFTDARNSYLNNPEEYFLNFMYALQKNGFSPLQALRTQASFLNLRSAQRTFEQVKSWLGTQQELDSQQQLFVFRFLESCHIQDSFRSLYLLKGRGQNLDELACSTAMKTYAALKTGGSRVLNPAPDVSLDSVCLCASALTDSAFTEVSEEILQANSFTASLMIGPALHIAQYNIALNCLETLSGMLSFCFREIRTLSPQYSGAEYALLHSASSA